MFSLLPQSISAFDLSFYSFSKTEALLFFSGNSMNWAILCRLFLGVGLCTALLSYVSSLLHPICLSLHLQSGTGRSYQLLPSVLPPLIVSSLWPDLDKKGMCTPPPRPAPPPPCVSLLHWLPLTSLNQIWWPLVSFHSSSSLCSIWQYWPRFSPIILVHFEFWNIIFLFLLPFPLNRYLFVHLPLNDFSCLWPWSTSVCE